MRTMLLVSLIILSLSGKASDTTRPVRDYFHISAGYWEGGRRSEAGSIYGSFGYARSLNNPLAIGASAEFMSYRGRLNNGDKLMVPLSIEVRKQNLDLNKTSFLALLQLGWAVYKTRVVNSWSERTAKGGLTWGAGAGVQFKSKNRTAFYALVKFRMINIKSTDNFFGETFHGSTNEEIVQIGIGMRVR
jgi:hypothetical protein